ncbi:MAG: OmpA family protein [Bacteroidia bacterium]|nr:OmpA family protein [Bacteroidia bacterium]
MKKYLLLAVMTVLLMPARAQQFLIDTVYFDFDSYILQDQHRFTLDSLINRFGSFPTYYVEIYGHTDSIGSEAYNLELSEQRARAVALYMREKGLILDRIEYKGLGTQKPVMSNETFEGRRLNRRADIAVVFSKEAPKPTPPPVAVVEEPKEPPVPVIDPASITDTFRLKKLETVDINPTHRTLIYSPAGGRIVIPPGAFVTSAETVAIEVKEMYERKDMILSEMPTVSKEGPLEGPGVLSFTATVDGREVKVQKDARFEVRIPATRRDEDMGVYSGAATARGGARNKTTYKLLANLPGMSPVKTWNAVPDTEVRYVGQDKTYVFETDEPAAYMVARPLYHSQNTDTKDAGFDIELKLKGKRFEKGTQVMIAGEVVKTYIPMTKKDVRTYTATKVKFLDAKTKMVVVAIQYDDQGNPWVIKRSFTPGEFATGKKKDPKNRPVIQIKAKFRKMDTDRANELLLELNK